MTGGLFPGMAWRCKAAHSPSRVHSQLLRGFLGCAGSALSAKDRSIWGQKGRGVPAPPGANEDRGICPSSRDPLSLNKMQKITFAFTFKGWEQAGSFWSGETSPCVLISFQMVGSIN